MRRIFWDAIVLIYLLDDVPGYAERVQSMLQQAYERKDLLFTSFVALGEVMAGGGKSERKSKAYEVRRTIDEMGFSSLSFGAAEVDTFSHLRSVHRVKTADAIHLACAASARMDLFLTNDDALLKLHVPGIHFIARYDTPIV